MTMKRNRTVASGSTIDGGGAISISPSRVQETGCGTIQGATKCRTRKCKNLHCPFLIRPENSVRMIRPDPLGAPRQVSRRTNRERTSPDAAPNIFHLVATGAIVTRTVNYERAATLLRLT